MASVDQIRTWPSAERPSECEAEAIRQEHTSSRRNKPFLIRGDMAAVYLKILLLSAMGEPHRANVAHDCDSKTLAYGAYLMTSRR